LDYGSAEEACENFARPNEIEDVEKNPGEKRGLCKTTRVEELCEAYGSTRSVEEKNEQEMVPSIAETYEVLEKVKAFFYAQSVSNADRENIISLEKSYFQLRQNSAKKQKTMYDFFCLKKSSFSDRFPAIIVCFLHPIEKR
jgi:hypothetical protein